MRVLLLPLRTIQVRRARLHTLNCRKKSSPGDVQAVARAEVCESFVGCMSDRFPMPNAVIIAFAAAWTSAILPPPNPIASALLQARGSLALPVPTSSATQTFVPQAAALGVRRCLLPAEHPRPLRSHRRRTRCPCKHCVVALPTTFS